MGQHHYFGILIISVLLLISTPGLSESVLAPGGLATGFEDDPSLKDRPNAGWENDKILFDKVSYWKNACFSACHNQAKRAEDTSIPYVAGQKFHYLLKQLEKFDQNHSDMESGANPGSRVWQRSNDLMNSVSEKVDSALFVYLADAISNMPCDGRSEPSAALALPPPPASLEQCTTCHLKNGQGAAYDIPILAGQSEAYMRRKMTSILNSEKGVSQKEGQNFRTHPVMGPILAKLVYMDFFGLAKYFSAQDCRG